MALLTPNKIRGLFFILISLFCTKLVSAAGVKWIKEPSFDDKLPNTSTNIISRSRTHCGEICSTDNTCVSFFYVPRENANCQLQNHVLNSAASLLEVKEASYYILEGAHVSTTVPPSVLSTATSVPSITYPSFSCPPDDTVFRTVTLDNGSLFTYRVIKQLVSQPDAKTECELQGAFLARVTTVHKMKMLLDLVQCTGYNTGADYYVDGSNTGAAYFYAADAWTMSNGDPVPMTTDFWAVGCPNNPHIEHCLRMRSGANHRWDDCNCINNYNFICEK